MKLAHAAASLVWTGSATFSSAARWVSDLVILFPFGLPAAARTPYDVGCTMLVRCTICQGGGGGPCWEELEMAKDEVAEDEVAEDEAAEDDVTGGAPRPALSTERVLREALRLADEEGLDAVSMRRLGRELGAGAMSLYHYVSSKDELLDGMVDLVFAEIEAPSGESAWRTAMRRRSSSARDVLLRHSGAVALMESRTNPGLANLQHREAVTACLRRAGFSIEMTVHANWLLDSYVYGFVLEESSLPFDTAEELADMADDVYMPLLPPEQYPYLNEVAGALLAGGYDHRAEFVFGLDVILDALERLREDRKSVV